VLLILIFNWIVTTLDITFCYRLMWLDLYDAYVLCFSYYVQQLSCSNLMNRRLIFFIKWAVIYKSLQRDLS
jgi:hypothetical protein